MSLLYRQLVLSVNSPVDILEFFYSTFEDCLNVWDKLICKVGGEVLKYQEFYRLWQSRGLVESVVVRKGISRNSYVWPESGLREILETMLIFQKSILQYLKKGQIRQNGGVITFLLQNERFWNLQVMFDSIQCDI